MYKMFAKRLSPSENIVESRRGLPFLTHPVHRVILTLRRVKNQVPSIDTIYRPNQWRIEGCAGGAGRTGRHLQGAANGPKL